MKQELYKHMKKEPIVSHRELLLSDKDHEKAARVINLVYIKETKDGITRIKKGKSFAYQFKNKAVRDKKVLDRINKLVIPPAWTNVWICPDASGHIQATGFDVRGRKQYLYHDCWKALRSETKFHRLYEFGKSLSDIRQKVEKDLAQKELTETKVLATLIAVMDKTYIRVGNAEYEKTNGSYGLTTMKDKHVSIEGHKVRFSFKGKKGIEHNITLNNKRLAKTVKECRDIPGKELFQYYEKDGTRKSIDSGMVNSYIRQSSGHDFSAKDFRTWAGSLQALESLSTIGEASSATGTKRNINQILSEVSERLGNTRAVCRKYYVHPVLIRMYEEGNLLPAIRKSKNSKAVVAKHFNGNENLLMKILNESINSGYAPTAA